MLKNQHFIFAESLKETQLLGTIDEYCLLLGSWYVCVRLQTEFGIGSSVNFSSASQMSHCKEQKKIFQTAS